MTEKPKIDPRVVILQCVRLSYPNLFHAKAVQGSEKKSFSASFIMDKVQQGRHRGREGGVTDATPPAGTDGEPAAKVSTRAIISWPSIGLDR